MSRPLTGIRVIGLEQYMSAPYCTMLLADAGAEVIKIERPGRGDPRRSIPPFATNDKGDRVAGGFIGYNRNKKSLTLNIREESGKKIFTDLVKTSDVVVENMRPGAVDLRRQIWFWTVGRSYRPLRPTSGFRHRSGGDEWGHEFGWVF
jgi:formyl-CoA transferase